MPAPTATVVVSRVAMMTAAGTGAELAGATPYPAGSAVTDLVTPTEAVPAGPGRLADRPSEMATATVGALLDGVADGCPPGRRGLVLGSGAAGMDQSMTVTTDSLTRTRPFNVSPALVPACVMNYASALCAIAHDLQGPNITVTAGRATGLAALTYGWRLIRRGRADIVACGAYEDLNERRAAIDALITGGGTELGEGCCAFVLETSAHAAAHGRPVLAEILAIEASATATGTSSSACIADVIAAALERSGTGGDEVDIAVTSATDEPACRPVLPNATWLRPHETVGDTFGAEAAFQVAAATLSERGDTERTAVVVVSDLDGQLACAVLRLPTR